MIFNSWLFIAIFVLAYGLYLLLIRQHRLQNAMLLLASYTFYDKMNNALSAWASQSDRVHHVMATPALFDASEIYNLDHTVGDAAREYTRQAGQALLEVQKK